MPHSLTIVAFDPARYLVASWNDIAFVYWLRQGTLEGVATIRAALQGVYRDSSAQTLSVVHLIRDGAGLPSADVRDAVLDMSAHLAPRTACLGVVLMGSGFWASAMQSILTALRVVAPRRSGVMRFASDPADLCEWFPAEHHRLGGRYIDQAQLRTVIGRVLDEGDSPGMIR